MARIKALNSRLIDSADCEVDCEAGGEVDCEDPRMLNTVSRSRLEKHILMVNHQLLFNGESIAYSNQSK